MKRALKLLRKLDNLAMNDEGRNILVCARVDVMEGIFENVLKPFGIAYNLASLKLVRTPLVVPGNYFRMDQFE